MAEILCIECEKNKMKTTSRARTHEQDIYIQNRNRKLLSTEDERTTLKGSRRRKKSVVANVPPP